MTVMRVFLVPLIGDGHDRLALDAACVLARAFSGRVDGLFLRPDPIEALSTLVEGASPAAIRAVTRAAQESLEERLAAATAALEAATTPGDGRVASRLHDVTGDTAALVAAYGRVSDLTVFAGPGIDDRPRYAMFEAALLHSTRATLLVPAAGLPAAPTRMAVAWNGTPEAARAVQAALPLLRAASEVHLLGSGSPRREPAALAFLADYLRVHEIDSVSHDLTGDGAIGAALVGAAKTQGAEVLIMGGYGRSRMQEMIFGGVTRHVLHHLDMPVLFAH
jgi:nucleotide-binding universal stress UspA family protein